MSEEENVSVGGGGEGRKIISSNLAEARMGSQVTCG